MKTLKEIKGKVHWTYPTDKQHDEIAMQLNMLMKHPKAETLPPDVKEGLEKLKSVNAYAKAIKDGKIKKIKPSKCNKIDNHTHDLGSFPHLKESKQKHVLDKFKKRKVQMPILLKTKEGRKWLIAHNTTLTYNSQVLGKKTPCLIIQ
jgi:hypothetical protein